MFHAPSQSTQILFLGCTKPFQNDFSLTFLLTLLRRLNARIHLRSVVYDGPAVNVNLEALSESSDSAAV